MLFSRGTCDVAVLLWSVVESCLAGFPQNGYSGQVGAFSRVRHAAYPDDGRAGSVNAFRNDVPAGAALSPRRVVAAIRYQGVRSHLILMLLGVLPHTNL